MRIVMLGPFGLHPKATMLARALPMARALGGRGHDVTVIMPPWHTPDDAGRSWTDEREPRVRVEYVSLAGLKLPALGHGLVAGRMARRAVAVHPEAVHVFKPKAYGGLAAWLLYQWRRLVGTRARIPVVVDTDDWEGPGGWNEVEPYSAAMRRFFAWQERWGLSHADHVTVASRALETLVWANGVPPSRVTYVPNAVEGTRADGARHASVGAAELPRDRYAPEPTFLLYTRFFEFDVRRPLAVLAQVRETVPNARMVVVGKGLFGEEKVFVRLAAEMALAEAVDYRGWVDAAGLAEAVRLADVAVYPFDDNLVNRAKSSAKVLELMAGGLPIVADRVGELAEVIEDGASGLLVPAGDVEAMALAVIRILTDADLGACLSDGARRRVEGRYCWEVLAARVEAAYGAARAAALGWADGTADSAV